VKKEIVKCKLITKKLIIDSVKEDDKWPRNVNIVSVTFNG